MTSTTHTNPDRTTHPTPETTGPSAAPTTAPGQSREVSRNRTSRGAVVWSRCSCGRLRMVYTPDSIDERQLLAGGRTPGCPDCL
ncbi:hypothetical protein [Streptomyces sp. B6B3]|uniref:hypothetical protein n=1 Tax=Streptomyces sp. B6B3 TaxID=3153570 RepID=UPI00325DAA3F